MADVLARNTAYCKLQRLDAIVKAIDPATVTDGDIKIHLKTGEEAMKKVEDSHLKVLRLLDGDNRAIADQEAIVKPMEELYQQIMASLYNFQATTGASIRRIPLKLPDIQLPAFDGKYEDWPSFADLFIATIEKNSSLSPSQKLQYLKTCTKGEAYNLVKTFTVTDANYKEAWKLLSQRYSNKREIVQSLVKKLIHQPLIKQESISSLQGLLNTTLESIRSLQVMGRPTEHWDDLITFIIIEKLDADTRGEWARSLKGSDPPTFTELQEFLEQHVRTLHAKGSVKQQTGSRSTQPPQAKQIHHTSYNASYSAPATCQICKEAHQLYRCPKLIAMQPDKRVEAVRATKACLNCLKDGHMLKECSSNSACRKCGRKHNTFLHVDQQASKYNKQSTAQSSGSSSNSEQQGSVRINHTSAVDNSSGASILFKTALVDILDSNSIKRQVRVFIDDGGEAGLIKSSVMKQFGLPKQRTDVTVYGAGDVKVMKSNWKTQVRLFSQVTDSFIDVDLYSVPKVTGELNRVHSSQLKTWNHIKGLQLADPLFYEAGEADISLGLDAAPYILKDGLKIQDRMSPVAQNTIFGWVLNGNVSSSSPSTSVRINFTKCEISDTLRKFWEMEEVTSQQPLTAEERACEEHFLSTHTRNAEGRYIVRLPFNNKKGQLGSTKEQAFRRLHSLERRFTQAPHFKKAYIDFMREYESLGHMEKVPPHEIATAEAAYLPHHFVLKEESTTTKQRTVFDGSAKSSTGLSLNNILMVGATVQPDLFTIIIRFRLALIALKADFAKMYRQYLVDKRDCDYQRILWREEPSMPATTYRLLTLTYGTGPAGFLATRCLNQLAVDEGKDFPLAAVALLKNTYVDDLHACKMTKEEAVHLINQLITIAAKAGMEIRKWCSNVPEVLSSLPENLKEECNMCEFTDNSNSSVKALGIKWEPSSDSFLFSVIINQSENITKRLILSEIAKTFDPLGWLSPVTVRAKLLLQKIWLESKEWDDEVSSHLLDEWNTYLHDLKEVENIRIPRCIITSAAIRYELHGFSDSSEVSMASAIYLKSVYTSGSVSVNLICSKTKVAPLKAISLPKLELSAAKLLAESLESVKQALELDVTVYCWTDSTITLRWISSHSRRWKTFVANRVAAIQTHVAPENWHHVKSEENPADLPSRGIETSQLITSTLWWNGPAWLQQDTYPVYPQHYNEDELKKEEKSKQLAIFHTSKSSTHSTLFNAVSSFRKLCRLCAYLIRYINYLQDKRKVINKEPLSTREVATSANILIRWSQRVSFPEDIHRLKKLNAVSATSKLLQLNPFIDSEGTLRVGGRIQRANLPTSTCHPIILSHDHPITIIIINDIHLNSLHSGFTSTLANIRRKYWISRGRDIIRYTIRKCVICRRHRAVASQQLMGSLPAGRVNATKAFLHTGVDFAGPFNVKVKKGRYYSVEKTYFAIFVCLATKAIHLESVDNLTSEGFIASFERFISRRGSCAHLYSDNGTNFIGADKIMQQFYHEQSAKIQQQFCNQGTQWHFNPPAAPHQGGLWEAGVKSVKYHFYRVVGQSTLVVDQFQTLLCKIEACLNSRPLCALSSDPTDLDALTPGHFLVGGPLTSIPEPDVSLIKENRLTYWETVRQLSQSFWKRWSSEYVTTLQQRFKWTQRRDNLQVGDLVVIMDENLPLTKWKLGRVINTHPGADGLVRSVTLKTASGESTRPINKLSPLIHNDEQ